MNPELLMLLKLHSDQYSLSMSMAQAIFPLFLVQVQGFSKDSAESASEHLIQEHARNSDKYLRALLEFLEKYYPNSFVGEDGKRDTIDGLIQKLNLALQDPNLN